MLNFLKQNSGKLLPQSTRKLFVKQTKQGGLQNSCGNLILNYKQVVTESLFVVAFLVSSWLGACFANGWRNFDPPRVAPTQFRKPSHEEDHIHSCYITRRGSHPFVLLSTKRITSIRLAYPYRPRTG